MICIFVILLSGWCRTKMRPARIVSYAVLYTTLEDQLTISFWCGQFFRQFPKDLVVISDPKDPSGWLVGSVFCHIC